MSSVPNHEAARPTLTSSNTVVSALSYVFQFLSPSKDGEAVSNGDANTDDGALPDLQFAVANYDGDATTPSMRFKTIPSRVVALCAKRKSVSSCLLSRGENGWWLPFLTPKLDEGNVDAAIRLLKMVSLIYWPHLLP